MLADDEMNVRIRQPRGQHAWTPSLVTACFATTILATLACDESADCPPGKTGECTCGCGYMGETKCSDDGTEWAECVCDYSAGQVECLAEGDACEGGKCLEVAEGQIVCRHECAEAGKLCGYGGNEACYFDEFGGFGSNCFPEGSKVVGEECDATNDCVLGAQCLDNGDGPTCWKVCQKNDDCEILSTCEDAGYGFSVCVPAEFDGFMPAARPNKPVARLRAKMCTE